MELAQQIRNDILSSTDPDHPIRENDLADKYKVSRSSIRDALKQLEVEKVIVRTKKRGTTLRKFTLKEISDIYDLRAALEGLAANQAARNISNDDAEHLKKMAAQCDMPDNDPFSRNQCDNDFHRKILALSNNPQLCEIVENFAILRRIFDIYLRKKPNARRRNLSPHSHMAIAEAIAEGNPEAAEKNMRDHIQWGRQRRIEEMLANGDV